MPNYKVVDSEQLNADLSEVAEAIREKGETSEALSFPDGFVSAIGAIPTGGGDTEAIEQMIDSSGVLDSTEGTVEEKVEQLVEKAEIEKHIYNASLLKENCQHEFRHWSAKKLPKTNYIKSIYFNLFAANSSIETIDYYLDWQGGGNFVSAFENTPNLKTIVGVNTAKASSVSSLFNKSGIVSIQEPFDFSNIINSASMSAFTTAHALVDLRIVPETWKWGTTVASGVLSAESIQSIIEGLAPVATTQTIKFASNISASLTIEQLTQINAKNWNVG